MAGLYYSLDFSNWGNSTERILNDSVMILSMEPGVSCSRVHEGTTKNWKTETATPTSVLENPFYGV